MRSHIFFVGTISLLVKPTVTTSGVRATDCETLNYAESYTSQAM